MSTTESRLVDVAPIRDAFLRSPMTLTDVCHRLDWAREHPDYPTRGKADISRLKRTLGLQLDYDGNGFVGYRRRIHPELAARIVRALDLDPVDLDL